MPAPRAMRLFLAVLLAAGGPALSSLKEQEPPTPTGAPSAFVDVVALDASGRPVTSLAAGDLTAAVDGQARRILSVRYVFRGPGATAAAAAATTAAGTPVLVEPSRLVLLVVDEGSIVRGNEKAAVSAAWRLLDAVAPADRVALVTLPVPRGDVIPSVDRQSLRKGLASVTGRAVPGRELTQADAPRPLADGAELDGAPPSSLRALARLLANLQGIAGPKAVVYLRAGAPTHGGDDPLPIDRERDLPAVVEAAAASRTSIHVVSLSPGRSDRTEEQLGGAARDTGGTVVRSKDGELDIGRVSAALSGGYLVEVETRAEDRDGRTHAVRMGTTRKGVAVLGPARWTPRDDPLPAAVAAPAPVAPTGTSAAGEGAPDESRMPAARRSGLPDPLLEPVLLRVSEYLDAYLRDFSDVVAEEDYLQRVMGLNNAVHESVRLRSDLLLVSVAGPDGWVPFRDVFEVNRERVRNREDRLRKLFLEQPGSAMAEARRVTEESARYNVGPVHRTVNLPTLPLLFLTPAHRSSFRFERRGEGTVEDLRVLRVDYEEVGRPTVITDGKGQDRPSSGSLWLDPATGRVAKTTLRNSAQDFVLEVTVVYRRSDTLGLWAPAKMHETYRLLRSRQTIVCEASYSNFRRFEVSTEVTITDPKNERPRQP